MKKSFSTLIKLQKSFVDEQRHHLTRLLENLELIETRIMQLEALRAQEQAAAAHDDVARMTYGAFLKSVIAKRRELENERGEAALAVMVAQEKLSDFLKNSNVTKLPKNNVSRKSRKKNAALKE